MGVTNFSQINPEYGTGTESSNAVTVNSQTGLITTSNLSTASQAVYTCTLTNNRIGASSQIVLMATAGSATVGTPVIQSAAIAAGTATIKIQNIGNGALNGTLLIPFWVLNPVAP